MFVPFAGKRVMMVTAAFLPGLSGGPLLRLRPMPSHTVALSMRTPLEDAPARVRDSWAAAQRQLNSAFGGTPSNEERIDRSVIERAFELNLPQKPPAAEMVQAASSAVDEETRLVREEEERRQEEEEPSSLLGWRLALLLVTASWGANFPATKLALDSLGGGAEAASLFIAARFVLSAIVLAPAALNASSVGAVKAGAAVGGLCAFGYVAQAAALAMGSQPATCAFICSLQAVVVALITASRGGGLAPKTAVAVGLAILGIGFLELPDVLAGGLDALCLGDLVAMGQPLGFGTSYVVIDQVPPSTLHPPPSTLHPPLSTHHPPPSTLHPPLSTLHPPPSILHPHPPTFHPPPTHAPPPRLARR